MKLFGSDVSGVDFSIPRRESKTGPHHRGFLATFDESITPQEAATRRDFTINAIAFDPVRGEVLDFFGGQEDLKNRVLRATSRIPFGETASYKQVASAAGSPNGYRAAGNALGANPLPIVVPCHRVLHSGGGIGGYTGGLDRKRILLAIEAPPS